MTPEQDDTLTTLTQSVKRIESALLGDEKIGHVGIVSKQLKQEKRIDALETFGKYLMGGWFVLGVLWVVFTQWPRK